MESRGFGNASRKIEVTACVPQKPRERAGDPDENRTGDTPPSPSQNGRLKTARGNRQTGRWRSIAWLESNGLLPTLREQLEQKVYLLHGEPALAATQKEWAAVTDLIVCHWRRRDQRRPARAVRMFSSARRVRAKPRHFANGWFPRFCVNEHSVRVWRLDGESANASEILSCTANPWACRWNVFGTSRRRSGGFAIRGFARGGNTGQSDAIAALREQLSVLPQPHIHLVLNAAYESSILFEQFHAFESFAPEDIIFTHLDEEHRRVKLWNFVLGTKCPISFLGAGQKIPGEFRRAEPALLFPQKNSQ